MHIITKCFAFQCLLVLLISVNVSYADHGIYKNSFEIMASCAIAEPEAGHSYFVSVDGQPNASGARNNPLDLATAISNQSPARDGDTIWLFSGTYTGLYVSEINGSPGSPITIRPISGQHVTIDTNVARQSGAGLTINGDWVIFRDFEVMSSDGAASL